MAIKTLNIGVDARPLQHPNSGIGRTTLNLLDVLINSKHNWFLYSDGPLNHCLAGRDNVYVRTSNLNNNRFLGVISAQIMFPLWAKKDRLDVFWSPRHHLPIFLSGKIRSVVTIHDLVWKKYPRTMTLFGRIQELILMPIALKKASSIVAVSQFTKFELIEEFPAIKSKLDVVYGASTFSFSMRECVGSDTGRINKSYFLFVGTFEPRKNLTRLLYAFSNYLTDSAEPLHLKIVGSSGWGKVALEKIIAELNIATMVDIVGYVDDIELSQIYKQAYALVMPSLYEGFGLPVVEAMSQGVPAIVSKNGALEEVGGSGVLLVDPLSIASITEKLSTMASSESRRNKLAEYALIRSNAFNWNDSADKMLNIMESAKAEK